MRREIDRLSRLAADLILLTQLEAGGGRLRPEPLDVGDLLVDLGEAAKVMGEGSRSSSTVPGRCRSSPTVTG